MASFSDNVVVAETSYQIYKFFSFCDQERALPLSINMTVLAFRVKSKRCLFSEICENDFKSNLILVVFLVLRFKDI